MFHLSLGLALTLVAGLASGVLVEVPLTLPLSVTTAVGWIATTLGFFAQRARLQLAGFVVAAFSAGWLLGDHALNRALYPSLRTSLEQRLGGFAIDATADAPAGTPITIEGRLRGDAALVEGGATLHIQVERVWIGPCPEPAAGGVAVGVGGALPSEHVAQWTAGRMVRAPVLLRRPARYLNHGLPDQERALARRGITLVGTIKSAALVEVVQRAPWWDEGASRVRAHARGALARHVAPSGSPSAAMATAILIGDRAGLDAQTERRLQEAGTYHVIAISGGNIAILAGLMLGAFALVGVRGRVAALAAIAALTAYAVIAAGGASVARATVMAVVYLAVRVIDQRTAAANAIGLSASILVLLNPLWVADVAFWLTFGATSAIMVGVSRVAMPAGSMLRAAATVFLASTCAELALAPVSALVFQRVTLAGLVLNFVALPAMTIVQLAAMAVVASDALGLTGLAGQAGRLVHAGGIGLTGSANLLDLAPWLSWRVPSPTVAVLIGYYVTITMTVASASITRMPRRARKAAAVVAAVFFMWIVVAPQARVRAKGDGRLHLAVMDVGQGDAMLVTFPDGRRLAVDTGGVSSRGQFDIGDRVLGPSLRARHVMDLDYLAITHGDPDHIGGAQALVRDFQPAEIWWGVEVANHEPAARLREEARRARSAWRTLRRGDRLEVGGVEVRVHHPPSPDWERQRVRNDDSLVLELRFGEVSMLLTGDIGRDIERELLPSLDLLPTVVLKVAHHGSGTSSAAAFVQRVKPVIALIGVGRANPYGHPLPSVLEQLQEVRAEVFRTDRDGQIQVTTDGRDLRVETWTRRGWPR